MMKHEIAVREVTEQPIAAVSERMRVSEVPRRFGALLSRVWEFFKTQPGLRVDGHNVMIYHHDQARDGTIVIEFGVQVVRKFEGAGDVVCSATPAGTVAVAMHVGPYNKLGETHDALVMWCKENNRPRTGTIWEIYGDHNDDPSKLETEVLYLLQ